MGFRNLRADANTARDLCGAWLPSFIIGETDKEASRSGRKKAYYMPQGFEGTCIRPVDFEVNIFVAAVRYLPLDCEKMLHNPTR